MSRSSSGGAGAPRTGRGRPRAPRSSASGWSWESPTRPGGGAGADRRLRASRSSATPSSPPSGSRSTGSAPHADGLALTDRGLAADPRTLATTLPGVFAGGDAVLGADLAVRAVAAGGGRRGVDRPVPAGRPVAGPEDLVAIALPPRRRRRAGRDVPRDREGEAGRGRPPSSRSAGLAGFEEIDRGLDDERGPARGAALPELRLRASPVVAACGAGRPPTSPTPTASLAAAALRSRHIAPGGRVRAGQVRDVRRLRAHRSRGRGGAGPLDRRPRLRRECRRAVRARRCLGPAAGRAPVRRGLPDGAIALRTARACDLAGCSSGCSP